MPLAEGTGYVISGIYGQLMQHFTTDLMNRPPEEEGILIKSRMLILTESGVPIMLQTEQEPGDPSLSGHLTIPLSFFFNFF